MQNVSKLFAKNVSLEWDRGLHYTMIDTYTHTYSNMHVDTDIYYRSTLILNRAHILKCFLIRTILYFRYFVSKQIHKIGDITLEVGGLVQVSL